MRASSYGDVLGGALLALTAVLLALPAPARAEHLEFVEAQKEGVGGVDGLAGVLSIVLSADGKYVYAAGPSDDAVAVFRRDKATGGLAQVQIVRDGVGAVRGLNFASALAISPDGAHVYVTGTHDDAVAAFRRNAMTGALDFVEMQTNGVNGVSGIAFARAVTLSPDGAFVYVAGESDNAIAVFRRNPMLGTLTFVSSVQDDTDGVDGLRTVLALAISPDGAHLYASGSNDNAIAAFKRDVNTGALTFIDVVKETAETPNLFGLLTTHSVAVSPDGAYVYASGQADHAVAVFRRNRTTGTLEFIDVRAQDVDGVDGLLGALWVAISPDGGHVYVTGTLGNSIAAFSRDAGSGALTFLGAKTNAVDDADGLAFARAAAVSPDGKYVYVGGASSNAIAVFRLAND